MSSYRDTIISQRWKCFIWILWSSRKRGFFGKCGFFGKSDVVIFDFLVGYHPNSFRNLTSGQLVDNWIDLCQKLFFQNISKNKNRDFEKEIFSKIWFFWKSLSLSAMDSQVWGLKSLLKCILACSWAETTSIYGVSKELKWFIWIVWSAKRMMMWDFLDILNSYRKSHFSTSAVSYPSQETFATLDIS